MTTEHEMTREEKAFEQFFDENKEMLSQSARTILVEAETAAYHVYLVYSCSFHPEEYEEAVEKMRLAVAETTARDRGLLMELVRRAIAASASIDPFDEETIVGYRVYRSDLHLYYRMVSDMVRDTLYEQFARERDAELEPIDDSDIPF